MFEVEINGELVGRSSPASLPGGPLESVRFLLENASRRGLPLKKGMYLLTGAVTGVHAARVGDRAEVRVQGEAPIKCHLLAEPTRS